MEKIVAVTFDIAEQECITYSALEWHNFIADTREQSEDPSASLEDLFDEMYGDEFWFDVAPTSKAIYNVAFDLRSEEFVYCASPRQVEFYMEMAEEDENSDEVFWA
jgi:hypothetical protein